MSHKRDQTVDRLVENFDWTFLIKNLSLSKSTIPNLPTYAVIVSSFSGPCLENSLFRRYFDKKQLWNREGAPG